MKYKNEHSFRILSGAEIETLADYFGQGSLGVRYSYGPREKDTAFHAIPKAYDNTIASVKDLSMSTDSNRSEERRGLPMRTCIEFRSGPVPSMTDELLHLLKAYTTWIETKKKEIRQTQYKDYLNPRRAETKTHDAPLSLFVEFYNQLPTTENQLVITSPRIEFNAYNAGPEFTYDFPETSEWVIRFEHEDLDKKYPTVFFAQYNLSIPIGCVFDPLVREMFPLKKKALLSPQEKEASTDFNENRLHRELRTYEKNIFLNAVALADRFFAEVDAPACALGMRDFLRGMAFEIAHISTSEAQLHQLFHNEALSIWAEQNPSAEDPEEEAMTSIETSLLGTLHKSLFSYFLKTTLGQFFEYLHPYEQRLLREIPKDVMQNYFLASVSLSNGGQRLEHEAMSYFTPDKQLMSEKFEDFYQETFFRRKPKERYPTDPIGWLTERLIEPINISLTDTPLYAVVLEMRQPEQGNQQFSAIKALSETYTRQHKRLLEKMTPVLRDARENLDRRASALKSASSAVSISGTFCQKKSTALQKANPKPSLKRPREPEESTKIYQKSDLWVQAKSYREDKLSLRSGDIRKKF